LLFQTIPSRRQLRRHQVLDSRDVDDGALNESFRQPVRIRIQSDFDGVAFDESSVVIRDVECLSVRQAKPERPEWLAVHPVFELLRTKHKYRGQSCGKTTRKSTPGGRFAGGEVLREAFK